MVKVAVMISALTLSGFGCGDIIKTRNPIKKIVKNDPAVIVDPVDGTSCGNFSGQYAGTCSGEGIDSQQTIRRNVDQSYCNFFQLVEGGSYLVGKDFKDLKGALPMITRAAFTDAERHKVELTESWKSGTDAFVRKILIDSETRVLTDTIFKNGDASPFTFCSGARVPKA